MIAAFFPVKKLRRHGKYVLFGAILLVGAVAVYHEIVAAKAWNDGARMNPGTDGISFGRALSDQVMRKDNQHNGLNNSASWKSNYSPPPWKIEYKGRANLHVFEDWCGGSTADLRRNMHYPLYPHSRTTVAKLAVSPQWTNYGLRIFGYLHPYTDGEFVFAVSSDDNSEMWLSKDDSPLNLQLLAWVGKTGMEWTAPGEFEKYASQTSRPVRLSAQRRYFFEVIHKQNSKGTDHVEVAWRLQQNDFRFMIIESKHISLYVEESSLLMSDVAHIPQTVASHEHTLTQHRGSADMLREDPRDSFYHVPFIDKKFLHGVLPDCTYRPSYVIKDFPLLRYQGLQFVHLSFIYPNDYTRLTHMETENSCFYPESPYYLKMFGFSRYLRLDKAYGREKRFSMEGFGLPQRMVPHYEDRDEPAPRQRGEQNAKRSNSLFQDYGDDFDDYARKRRRKLFAVAPETTPNSRSNAFDRNHHKGVAQPQPEIEKPALVQQQFSNRSTTIASKHLSTHDQIQPEKSEDAFKKVEQVKSKEQVKLVRQQKFPSAESTLRPVPKNVVMLADGEQPGARGSSAALLQQQRLKQRHMQRPRKMNNNQIQRFKDGQQLHRNASATKKPAMSQQRGHAAKAVAQQPGLIRHVTAAQPPLARRYPRVIESKRNPRDQEVERNMPLQQEIDNAVHRGKAAVRRKEVKMEPDARAGDNQLAEEDEIHQRTERRVNSERDKDYWVPQGDTEGAVDEDQGDEVSPPPVFDTDVNWNQTFQISHVDLQTERSDWIDLHCNLSGNLLLHPSDAQPMVASFMERLNHQHDGRFTLVRVVNIVKRVDGIQGSRYLIELQLKDEVEGKFVRLSHYIYALIQHSRRRSRDFRHQELKPQLILCNPKGFSWNPDVMVNIIVPVKNQARWVRQLITDMEELYRETGDTNFNLIITDYSSTDMDVEKALHTSSLHQYQYVRLAGNFERSAGLQAGIELISDDHSIVFLCDLHIYFPHSIIDTIRKHCVEGYMAFAPIVLRLDCGATSSEARGYWEVNGFGLLGIYKSDLDAVGGMNTKEFTDRWGGEDWELLDRILQAGLEVERIYLRNFFHHYHSKRGMWNRRMSPSHR